MGFSRAFWQILCLTTKDGSEKSRLVSRFLNGNKSTELVLGKVLDNLIQTDLIESGEDNIVRFAVKWLMGEASSLRPESVFSLMMDEDSPLPHKDQLLGSLTVVE